MKHISDKVLLLKKQRIVKNSEIIRRAKDLNRLLIKEHIQIAHKYMQRYSI